jgi:putative transposase
MPEHVHLLVSEPRANSLAVALQALKLSVARRSERGQFWQARYYDFNVYSDHKRFEKLDYMHWNPVKRGLVERMEDWQWSSYRFYRTGQQGRVFIQSGWVKEYKPD